MTTQKKIATLVKPRLPGFTGNAALYRLDPPLEHQEYGSSEVSAHEYVIASAVQESFGIVGVHETYLFPASPEGKVTCWGELPGSMRGTTSHADALREAGYEVAS